MVESESPRKRGRRKKEKEIFILNDRFKEITLAFFDIFMGCETKDHKGFFHNALPAAAYYVALMEMPSKPFENIVDSVKVYFTGKEINRNNLVLGRDELLSYGFLAQIILLDPLDSKKSNLRSCLTHSTRGDLPVSPELIWEIKKHLTHMDASEHVKNLQTVFKKSFQPYGLDPEKNSEVRSITCLYSSRWFYYTLINNILTEENCKRSSEEQLKLHMMFGKLGSFKEPYVNYYEKMFAKGLKIEALLDERNKDIQDDAKLLKKKYPKVMDIRFTPIALPTIRHLVSDKMAIDARKIRDRKEPSYIGTIYLAEDVVSDFKNNFATLWAKAK